MKNMKGQNTKKLNQRTGKRILSILLFIVMMAGMLPAEAIAEGGSALFGIVFTSKKELTYTFSGIGDSATLEEILHENDVTLKENYNKNVSVDTRLVSQEEEGKKIQNNRVQNYRFTALDWFDETPLTLTGNKGNVVTIALKNPDNGQEPTEEPEDEAVVEGALYFNDDFYLTGHIPGNGIIDVRPVTIESPDGNELIVAYTIDVYANANQQAKGKTWKPAGKKVRVHWRNDQFKKATEVCVYHYADDRGEAEPEIVAENVAVDNGWIEFDAESFSVYAVTGIIEKDIEIGGDTYRVTLKYDSDSGIPADAELEVYEVDAADYEQRAIETLGAKELTYAKALNIAVVDKEGNHYQPTKNVELSIRLLGEEALEDAEIVHFAEGGARVDIIEPLSAESVDEGYELTFETDGFSVFMVVTTVLEETLVASDGNTYKITVSYDENSGLPTEEEGAHLSVTEILNEEELAGVTTAIDSERAENRKVALSRTFDIKILDKDENEVQPNEGANVQVTFELVQVGNQNLTTDVYHLKNEGEALTAENLAVTTDTANNIITVTTDGFSLYTVEFTYEGKQYVLDGGNVIRLDAVLAAIGITGNIENVEISDWSLFEAVLSDDNNWYVYALNPFDTTEWMKVTVDGVVFEIVVTDDYIGGSGTGYPGDVTFASGADISTISVKDLTGMTGSLAVTGNISDLGTTNRVFGYSGTLSQSQIASISGTATITYTGAAETADGRVCDVVIEYSDVTLFGDTRTDLAGNFVIGSVWGGHRLPGVKGELLNVTTDNSPNHTGRYGLQETITVHIYETGTTTPVDGTFMLTVNDINVNRVNTSARNIVNHEDYIWFTERIRIPDIANCDAYYPIGGVLTVSGTDIYNPGTNTSTGGGSYATGFAVQARNGFSFIGYNSGGNTGFRTEFDLMPRAGINHILTSYSGYGGSIATATSGNAADIVVGGPKYLEGGTVASPREYVVPTDKTVQYLLKPNDATYQLKYIEIDGSVIDSTDVANNSQITVNGDGSYVYTFANVGTTHKIAVFWEPTTDPELSVGHVAMEPAAGGTVVHTSLQGQVPTDHPAYINGFKTTVPKDGTPSVLGDPSIVGFAPPAISGYTHFSYALGLPLEDESVPQTYYAKSDNLAIRYTAAGEYQYSVNYTNDGNDANDRWETWTVTDELGNRTKPTLYAIYTKDAAGEERYVYTAATAISRNDTDPGFVDPNMDITFDEKIYRVTYTYTIKNPYDPNWNAASTDYLTVVKSAPVELTSNVHTHKPGQSHGHALGYKVYESTLAPVGSSDDITVTLYADYMVVTETAPANYTLVDILKKHGDQRGHIDIAANGQSGAFTIYTAGTDANAGFTFTRSGDATNGYFFSAMPESVPTDTEVEFINSRDTVELTLKEILEDSSHEAGWTHPFHITVRARELWTETNWQGNTVQREHYSMLGTYTITAQNELTAAKTGVTSSAIAVPKNADIIVIERFGETAGSNVKYTNYDTTVESDPSGITAYRPLDKEYLLSTIAQDTTITFTNTLKPRVVTVIKRLIGGDLSRTFNFTGLLTKGGSPVYDVASGTGYLLFTDANNAEVRTDAEGKFSFTLSGNGSVEIKVPYGSRLEITEVKEASDAFETVYTLDEATAVDGVTATVNGDASNGITVDHELVFTNKSDFSVLEGEAIVTYEFYLAYDENSGEFSNPYTYTLSGTGDEPLSTYRQFLREGSVLGEPQQPEAPAGQVFQGWYKADGTKCEDFNKTVTFDAVSDSTRQFGATDGDVVKLYAKFAEVRYVTFHENKVTDANNNVTWPVMEIVAVEKNAEGRYIIDLSAYTASSEDYREFTGWATTPENATAATPVVLPNEAYDFTAVNGNNINLYPGYNMKFRVSFYTGESGSGATYINSRILGRGEQIGTVLPAEDTFSYKGYVFAGWYYDEEYTQQVQAADTITEDKTLYAKWDLPDSATYKVVVWTQNPSDKPGLGFAQKKWEYNQTLTFTHTYDKSNDENNIVTPDGSIVKTSAGLNENFTLALAETGYVETDGSTILDVYFDRAVYTVIIKKGDNWDGKPVSDAYVRADSYSTTEELYGMVNGQPVPITYKMYAWVENDGTEHRVTGANSPQVYSSYTTGTNNIGTGLFGPGTNVTFRSGQVYNNYSVSDGAIGTILTIQNYLGSNYITSATPVTAEWRWVTDSGAAYDIEANGAYRLKGDPDELARYTGLYQGKFNREEKITPLLDTDDDGTPNYSAQYTFDQAGSYGATAIVAYNFDAIATYKANNPGRVTLSDDKLTWTFYAQTITANDAKLYYDYYKLPSGTKLSEFMTSIAPSGNTDNHDYEVRDPKANIINSDYAQYTQSKSGMYYPSGTSVGARYVMRYQNSTTSGSYSVNGNFTSMDDSKFAGYTIKSYASYYHGNGRSGYGPNEFVTAISPTDLVRNTSTGNVEINQNGVGTGGRNPYALFLYDNRNATGTRYQQAIYDTSGNSNGTYYVVKVVYVPDKHNVEFVSGGNTVQTLQVYTDWSLNDSTILWNGSADYVSGAITQKDAYDTFLSQGKNLQGQALTDPANQNRIFKGWYYDEECTQPFDPAKPVTGNIQVFAKWETRYYVVQIDPAGGVLTGGTAGSTWFWPAHGDTIKNYIVERNYDEFTPGAGSAETVYYYSNYQYEDWNGTYDWDSDKTVEINGTIYNLNDYTNPPHTATYGTDSSVPNDGKSYREMTGLYSLDRWDYQYLNDDGTQKTGPTASGQGYDFSTKVTSNLRLIAVWKKVAPFTIRYEVGDGKFVTAQAPYENFYGDETGFNPATATSFDVPGTYLDGATFTIAKAAVPNDSSKQFLGWDVKGGGQALYPLGSEYTVSSRDADENMVITLVALYGQIELTSLRYDANGGEGQLTDVTAKTENVPVQQVWSAGDNSLLHIELNDAVPLSGGAGFYRAGFEIIGWSKELLTFVKNTSDQYVTNDTNATSIATYFTETSGVYTPATGKENICFRLGNPSEATPRTVVVDGATGNVLYAVWKEAPYKVTINAAFQDGTEDAASTGEIKKVKYTIENTTDPSEKYDVKVPVSSTTVSGTVTGSASLGLPTGKTYTVKQTGYWLGGTAAGDYEDGTFVDLTTASNPYAITVGGDMTALNDTLTMDSDKTVSFTNYRKMLPINVTTCWNPAMGANEDYLAQTQYTITYTLSYYSVANSADVTMNSGSYTVKKTGESDESKDGTFSFASSLTTNAHTLIPTCGVNGVLTTAVANTTANGVDQDYTLTVSSAEQTIGLVITITATVKRANITVNKSWDTGIDTAGVAATFTLSRNDGENVLGETTAPTLTLTSANANSSGVWVGALTDIPVLRANETGVNYVLTETAMKNGSPVVYGPVYSGVTQNGNQATFDFGASGLTVNVTNMEKVKLTVTKETTGAMGDQTKEFTFTLSGLTAGTQVSWTKQEKTAASGSYSNVSSSATGTATADNSGCITFELKHWQKIELMVPPSVALTLTEDHGYYTQTISGPTASTTTSVSDVSDGKQFTLAGDDEVNFTNDLAAVSPTGIALTYAPYALMLLFGALILILAISKRRGKERS